MARGQQRRRTGAGAGLRGGLHGADGALLRRRAQRLVVLLLRADGREETAVHAATAAGAVEAAAAPAAAAGCGTGSGAGGRSAATASAATAGGAG